MLWPFPLLLADKNNLITSGTTNRRRFTGSGETILPRLLLPDSICSRLRDNEFPLLLVDLDLVAMTRRNDDPEATAVQSAASSSPSLLTGDETNLARISKKDHAEGVPASHGKIFDQPGSIPLPNAGYHSLGVVWEDVTVYGAGGGKKYVESFEVSIFKVSDYLAYLA